MECQIQGKCAEPDDSFFSVWRRQLLNKVHRLLDVVKLILCCLETTCKCGHTCCLWSEIIAMKLRCGCILILITMRKWTKCNTFPQMIWHIHHVRYKLSLIKAASCKTLQHIYSPSLLRTVHLRLFDNNCTYNWNASMLPYADTSPFGVAS